MTRRKSAMGGTRAPGAATLVEIGCAGHFIGAADCRWHRHTQIGGVFRVSTVGDYFPRGLNRSEPTALGWTDRPHGANFETMVFRTTDKPADGADGCGCVEVESFTEIAAKRYATAGEAQAGHEAFVVEYAAAIKAAEVGK